MDALRPGRYALGRGTDIGLHSLTVKRLRPDVTVVAFEPKPAISMRVDEAAKANGLDVRIERRALGREAGESPLFLTPDNSGLASVTNWHRASAD